MLLSKPAILRKMEEGEILIDPFNPKNLANNHYDVTLGKYYWIERKPEESGTNGALCKTYDGRLIYNMYDEDHVRSVWKLQEAQSADNLLQKLRLPNKTLRNIKPEDLIIPIHPGESMLCHTEEFIGGRGHIITTMAKTRSSAGRNFLETSRCAGMGDVGFHNRWTLEIHNDSRYFTIPLVVGRRLAKILFFEVEEIAEEDMYHKLSGKYQSSDDVEDLKRSWSPEMMLPKMYNDFEIADANV